MNIYHFLLLIHITLFNLLPKLSAYYTSDDREEHVIRELLDELTRRSQIRYQKSKMASWNYESNITKTNMKRKLAISEQTSEEHKRDWRRIQEIPWHYLPDYDLRRQFWKLSRLGSDALPQKKAHRLEKIINKMKTIYAKAKICAYDNPHKCDLSLEPDIMDILSKSKNPAELKYVWLEWHDVVGSQTKELYADYVDLMNEASRLSNFTSTVEKWLEDYEDSCFADQIEEIWQQLRPLYLQLHAYVRTQLRKQYGEIVSPDGPIPAHLLGNLWGQNWRSIALSMLPFPEARHADVNKKLKKQGYTPIKIFKTAEDFYTSLNLSSMPRSFWKKSIFVKPKDRDIICHASAWDFGNGKDFRIKQCTEVNIKHFVSAHHEMGHVQYYLQYKNQPFTYQRGANPGFHESVGDLISLSAQSRKHLDRIGLLECNQDVKATINSLFEIAMHKLVLPPFAYMTELWRWSVFRGEITPEEYNCKWWELKLDYQGIRPPIKRSKHDFDAAAKYHIVANVPYLKYFVSYILQFQFHRSLCEIAGEYEKGNINKPLHDCDIYGSTNAGNVFKKMLQMGSSRPWPDALEVVTGQRTLNASAILEYFDPLRKWLEYANKKSGAYIGWKKLKVCTNSK